MNVFLILMLGMFVTGVGEACNSIPVLGPSYPPPKPEAPASFILQGAVGAGQGWGGPDGLRGGS